MISFTVFGTPVAQGRAKFAVIGGHARAYDPAKSRNYKQIVRAEAVKVKPDKPLEGALSLTVKVYREIPKSFSRKKRAQAIEGSLRPTTKPDLSNLVKGIEDALNSIIYRDDAQLVDVDLQKFYSEQPRVEVEIREAI